MNAIVQLCHSGKTSDLGLLDSEFLTKEPSLRYGNTLKFYGKCYICIYILGGIVCMKVHQVLIGVCCDIFFKKGKSQL